MCLLVIVYDRTSSSSPIMIAANREERYDRRAEPPAIRGSDTKYLAPRDREAGGTWLGVNQFGVIVAVTNRPKSIVPDEPRSRGLLCNDLLSRSRSSLEALAIAEDELSTDYYAGANYLCADRNGGYAIHAGDRLESLALDDGLNLIANSDLNDGADPRLRFARSLFEKAPFDSADLFVNRASFVCAHGPDHQGRNSIVVRGQNYGTVSSTVLVMPGDGSSPVYLFADGPPDRTGYHDYSELMPAIVPVD